MSQEGSRNRKLTQDGAVSDSDLQKKKQMFRYFLNLTDDVGECSQLSRLKNFSLQLHTDQLEVFVVCWRCLFSIPWGVFSREWLVEFCAGLRNPLVSGQWWSLAILKGRGPSFSSGAGGCPWLWTFLEREPRRTLKLYENWCLSLLLCSVMVSIKMERTALSGLS